jgi:UDP-N-acetyl-D-mannosaminuronic acid transferase (WecB/TagA/CpsF family)
MVRKAASDSISQQIRTAQAGDVYYPVPEGLEKLTESEQTVWNLHITALNTWKDHELYDLHRLCKMHSRVEQLRADGASNTDISRAETVMQSQKRMMGLQTTHEMARKKNKEGKPSQRGKRSSVSAGTSLLQ